MSEDQATIMIGLLTEIREAVRVHRGIDVTIRFDNPPAHLDRRTLDELKRTLVHEIRGTADPL